MNLVSKYNVAAPRYTSYPTVPYWENKLSEQKWMQLVSESFIKYNQEHGMSIYIHLPYCESLCTYCACNTRITVNHGVEIPYINALLEEWKMYLKLFNTKPRIKELHLGGGTPTFFSPKNLNTLIKTIIDSSIVEEKADFSFEGHPNNTSTEHLETLFALGFKRVSFGIQDFDGKVQEVINRVQPYHEVERAILEARRIGYESVNVDLVYGLPFQTSKTVAETIEAVIQLKPDRIAFYSYAHVPWLKPGQRKFTEKDLPLDKEKRALYEIGLSLFTKAGYIDVGMDHFAFESDALVKSANNGNLHRNFMGYTSNYTKLMVGLGASAISDAGTAFAQNHKTVEEYLSAVRQQQFAINKGHVLSKEDMLIRRIILDIMCKYKTNWCDSLSDIPAFKLALERCDTLQKDGLLNLNKLGLEVTKTGKAFLRNICLCFDSRYWKKTPEKEVFSSVA